MVTYCH